jgi:hypothetical protein
MVGYVRKQKGGCRRGIACAARKGKEKRVKVQLS